MVIIMALVVVALQCMLYNVKAYKTNGDIIFVSNVMYAMLASTRR